MALLRSAGAEADPRAFPSRAITILVADERDESFDATARAVAQGLSKLLNQTVTIESPRSPAGLTAQTEAAKARPDGYTLLMADAASLTMAPRLVAKSPYGVEDFVGLGSLSDTPLIIAVPAGSRFQSFAELVADAKASPGAVRLGHAGNGTTSHLAILRLQQRLGVAFTAVAAKASADGFDGTVDATVERIPREPGRGGAFKPLAVTSLKRAATLPETPTLNEIGLKGFEIVTVAGLLAPAGTPPERVKILADALQKAIDDPEVEAKLKGLGSEPRALSPDVYGALLKQEDAAAARMLEEGLLKPE